jgi:metallo-beta-lactamase family protein
MKLSFFGGAGSVTGANYLLEVEGIKLLIDCGLFQGDRDLRLKNHRPWAYDPKEIHALLLTHAHADHNGRVPKLVKDGFRGPIISTPPTLDLSELSWRDATRLLAQDAAELGEEPPFSEDDVSQAIKQFDEHKYHQQFEVAPGIKVTIQNAAHILGSCMFVIEVEGKRIVFSGDVGNPPNPLLPAPEAIASADYLIIETAYGDRTHETHDTARAQMQQIAIETINKHGVLMIPSFAIERTQEILYDFNEMVEANNIPRVPIYLDSPLAIRATEIYKQYTDYFNDAAQQDIQSGDKIFDFPGLEVTMKSPESKRINDVPAPKIIIAGSGNSMGGRILHHEKRYLQDKNSTLLIVGYQAEGGLGRQIVDGAKEVEINGDLIPVRCRVEQISGYSGHADSNALYRLIENITKPVQKIFMVQGDQDSAETFAKRVQDGLGIDSVVPNDGESFDL